jgi:flagellar motor protein MotB
MRSRRRRARQEDSNVWIAYTDLLTALLTFFVILTFIGMLRLEAMTPKENRANLFGQVLDGTTRELLAGCKVKFGREETKTDVDGKFTFYNINISTGGHVRLVFEAAGYKPYTETLELQKGQNTRKFYIFQSQEGNKGGVEVEMLEGDAFFESGRSEIKREALQKLIALGQRYRENLKSDEVLVIQGHTDDVPYNTAGRSNWELSGDRAAALCRVFQEPKYGVNIPGRQLAIMGYGEFRSRHDAVIVAGDSVPVIEKKREKNRRIEIRKLKGTAEIFSSGRL